MAVYLKSCGVEEVKWVRVSEEDVKKSIETMKAMGRREIHSGEEVAVDKENEAFEEMVNGSFLSWLMMRLPNLSFHAHTRLRNSSRPRS